MLVLVLLCVDARALEVEVQLAGMEGACSLFWVGAMTTLFHGCWCYGWDACVCYCASYEVVRVEREDRKNQLDCISV